MVSHRARRAPRACMFAVNQARRDKKYVLAANTDLENFVSSPKDGQKAQIGRIQSVLPDWVIYYK